MADEPVRQGDVFRWLEPSDDAWKQHGVVVTADCDLEYDKHAGIVTYVPVLAVHDYLAAFFLRRRLGRRLDTLADGLLSRANSLREVHAPSISTPFSLEAISLWFRASGGAAVADALNVPGGDARSEFEALTNTWAAASDALASGDFQTLIDALVLLLAQTVDTDRARHRLDQEISDHLSSLPGDGLFLSCIGVGLDTGYVAYVRRPRELDQSALATRQSQASDPHRSTQRVSRLGSPYRYRLTQQLGQVFGDVGLPQSYEDARAANTLGLITA
jgi:hypothetical protein